MNGTCKDCEHWGDFWRENGWGECQLTTVKRDKPTHPKSLAIVEVDWAGGLLTSPDFGCVQFEVKSK